MLLCWVLVWGERGEGGRDTGLGVLPSAREEEE
jgi:hypothetical protein